MTTTSGNSEQGSGNAAAGPQATQKPRDMEWDCKIEGNEIVMRIPVAILPRLLAESEYAEECRALEVGAIAPAVVDASAFAPSMVRAINGEGKSGPSPFEQMLEGVLELACEHGAEGVDYGVEAEP